MSAASTLVYYGTANTIGIQSVYTQFNLVPEAEAIKIAPMYTIVFKFGATGTLVTAGKYTCTM